LNCIFILGVRNLHQEYPENAHRSLKKVPEHWCYEDLCPRFWHQDVRAVAGLKILREGQDLQGGTQKSQSRIHRAHAASAHGQFAGGSGLTTEWSRQHSPPFAKIGRQGGPPGHVEEFAGPPVEFWLELATGALTQRFPNEQVNGSGR